MTRPQPPAAPWPEAFGRAHVPLPTAPQAAAADRAARERFGVPERVLMENAGRAAAQVLQQLFPAGAIVGVAGSGNNGGDLLVMLRVLRAWGRDVRLIAGGSRPPDPALTHGADLRIIQDEDEAVRELARCDLVVDGLLGTGTTGAPRGAAAEWIRRINGSGRKVVALDLPSGVDATTGQAFAEAVNADVTVTFGWPKLGLMLQPARQHCGRLVAVEIGFPDAVTEEVAAVLVTPAWVRRCVTPREPGAHKGSTGRLLVLAGSSGMAGAAVIAAEAAIRAGAGLVRVASAADNRVILQTLVPEATFLDSAHLEAEDLEPMHALVGGPGMGQADATWEALDRALELMAGRPALLDADALNVLAREPSALSRAGQGRDLVITPHARELSRLSGASMHDILADPCAAARDAASRFGCVVLLKGQPSVIAAPDGGLLVNTTGSSDTATAGMGDQLAGTIGALLAGGMKSLQAAGAGLFLSGRAADLCGLGRALTPRDVSGALWRAFQDPGSTSPPLGLPFVTFDQPARW